MSIGRCNFIIPQSSWIQEYSESLKIGKFLILELNIPENDNIKHDWSEEINRAINNLLRVEAFIKEGKWYDAIESSRKISELFKFKINDGRNKIDPVKKEKLKELFTNANLSNSGFDELCSLIENLFNFISKFEHEKDVQGNWLPTPVPQKEDAYFVYSISVALVNMISNKIKK